jgi:hypothetical protein
MNIRELGSIEEYTKEYPVNKENFTSKTGTTQ